MNWETKKIEETTYGNRLLVETTEYGVGTTTRNATVEDLRAAADAAGFLLVSKTVAGFCAPCRSLIASCQGSLPVEPA